ncbi:hypothetical protein JZU54_03880, partial [bacterium]|nr:hypothetical protein [bacterium]
TVGGFESLSLAVNNSIIELGANVGQYNAAAGTAINQSASSVGTASAYMAAAVIGKFIGDKISDGYGVDGTGSAVVNVGTVIGASIAGPIGAVIGATIGGLFNRTFGMRAPELQSSGIRGNISSGGLTGTTYANYEQKGGLLQSDRHWTDTSGISGNVTASLNSAFGSVQGAMARAAQSLGLSAQSIMTYSKDIDIAAGTTEEALAGIFTGIADDMATAATPGLQAFAKAQETASATLSRLSASLTTTNTWLSLLRQRTYQVSLASADAAAKLADLFGGLGNFTSAAKAFYETFYTEGERAAQSQDDMAKALALVNLALPASKDTFRDLAASLDLNTVYGRQAYAVLLAIAPEFAATT